MQTQELLDTPLNDTLSLVVELPVVGNSGKIVIHDMGKTSTLNAAKWEFTSTEVGDEFSMKIKQEN